MFISVLSADSAWNPEDGHPRRNWLGLVETIEGSCQTRSTQETVTTSEYGTMT